MSYLCRFRSRIDQGPKALFEVVFHFARIECSGQRADKRFRQFQFFRIYQRRIGLVLFISTDLILIEKRNAESGRGVLHGSRSRARGRAWPGSQWRRNRFRPAP